MSVAAPRVGILGGTFDPPHLGHLVAAEVARDRLGLDQVWLMVAASPPHKARASALEHRLAMARLAAADNPALVVSDLEAHRDGPSYTVDTLRQLHHLLGPASEPGSGPGAGAELFFLAGTDVVAELGSWREPEACLALARFVVLDRPGAPGVGDACPYGPLRHLGVAPLSLASTQLRALVASGRSIRYLVPDAVAAYIELHGLYRAELPGEAAA